MVPAPNDASPDPERRAGPEADGGEPVEFDEAALYTVVREAVKDALLDVIGTLLLVGIAFVLVAAGGQAVVSSGSVVETGLGLLVALFGIYLAATSLEVIAPVREWF
jgi:hypothetical protein